MYLQAALQSLAQKNYLQRMFEDALVPNAMFLALAPAQPMPPARGGSITATVPGTMDVSLDPMIPGDDAVAQSNSYEWYIATIEQYNGSRDIPMNQAALTLAGGEGYMMEIMGELGIQCATTLNLLARNALYKAYLAGNTMTYDNTAAATSVFLVSGNGFRTKVVDGLEQAISVANPRNVRIDGQNRIAVGWTPINASQPDGPGTLTVTVAITVATNKPVLAEDRSRIIRPNNSPFDNLQANDIATLALFRRAVAELENDGVPPMPDGKYHCHVSPSVQDQLMSDNEYQRLFQGVPEQYIPDGSIGTIGKMRFFVNNQTPQPGAKNSPNPINIGAVLNSERTTLLAPYYFGELYNFPGVQIQRSIVVGRGSIKTMFVDEMSMMLAEASAPVGQKVTFAMVGQTMQLMAGSSNMGNVRITIRPPIDRAGQQTAITWTTTRGYAVTSNLLSGQSNGIYKRSMVIETGFQPLDA